MSSVHVLLQISMPKMLLGKVEKKTRQLDLLLIFPYFRMKWRDKFSHSNTWKSTDNFVLCRAHGTHDVVVIWDRAVGARLVPSWSHTQVFSSKDAQPPTKFKDRHYPHQNSEANKMRVEKKWWKKLDKLLSVNTQPLLRNFQVLNKDVCVHTFRDLNWNPEKLQSIYVCFDSSLPRPCDRQMAAEIMLVGCAACLLP